MKIFNVERKKWRLFRNMYASISDKIYQEIILKVGDVCALFLTLSHVCTLELNLVFLFPYMTLCTTISALLNYGAQVKRWTSTRF
jgi:hypothetical protein